MRVNLYATFRQIAGVPHFDLDLPEGTTVLEAVDHITTIYPALRPHWFSTSGELYAHVHIFINGHETATLPLKLLTILQSTDTLDILPPVAGG